MRESLIAPNNKKKHDLYSLQLEYPVTIVSDYSSDEVFGSLINILCLDGLRPLYIAPTEESRRHLLTSSKSILLQEDIHLAPKDFFLPSLDSDFTRLTHLVLWDYLYFSSSLALQILEKKWLSAYICLGEQS